MALLIDATHHGESRRRLNRTLRAERSSFAAKTRAARAILGLSQDEFAQRVGLVQKSVHRIEQGIVEPKLRTILAIEAFWCENGISFEDVHDGGFRLAVEGGVLADR
jgi:DNA-binding XRE family transcriptional regulator